MQVGCLSQLYIQLERGVNKLCVILSITLPGGDFYLFTINGVFTIALLAECHNREWSSNY